METNKQESIIVKPVERVILPQGEYTAELASVKHQTHPQYGESINFRFKITGPDFVNQSVFGSCSPYLTDKSKLLTWIQSLGGTIMKDTEFDVSTLVGKHARVYVTLTPTGKNKVTAVSPLNRVVPTVNTQAWSAPPQVQAMQPNTQPRTQVSQVQPQIKVNPSALDF